ncbi:MAG: type VI secretion system tip protein TssI/VgrG [Nannocystaceae bacterium]
MGDQLPFVDYTFECAGLSWRVRALVLRERLGDPFTSELRLIYPGQASPADLLGRPSVLTMSRGDRARAFHGEVVQAELYAARTGETHARVRFEPVIARAGMVSRHRIFQDVSVLDIVKEVLGPYDQFEWSEALQRSPHPRDYCVQYGESDLAFVQRLLDDEGISWSLEDRDDKHTFRLLEGSAAFEPIGDEPLLSILSRAPDLVDRESLQHLAMVRSMPAPGVVERDWQWVEAPASVGETIYPADATEPLSSVFHPRRWADGDRDWSTQQTYERNAATEQVGEGHGNVIAMAPGRYFSVELGEDEPTSLLVVDVTHRADCPDAELQGDAVRRGPNYTNTFECRRLDVPFRPRSRWRRTRIHGVQTAVVTGPDGEEIHTDALGRIRVRMHWDRSDSDGGSASCWIRVSQPWAGAGWGASFIPRVGMEVLIAFVDGDPDRPMCVGCVYNGGNPTPQTLPDERTRAVLRTRSTPGGNGFNELSFEDAAGGEQVYLHAQRNLDEIVRANASRRVGVDEHEHVGRDRATTIARHQTHAVDGDRMRQVGGNEGVTVSGSQHVVILGGPGKGSDTGAPPVPGADLFVHGRYELWARDEIVVHCGPSSITIGPAGIQITAPVVTVTGGGSQLALSPGLATTAAPAIALAGAKAGLQIDDVAKLTSEVQVRVQVGDSRLTLDGTARLRAPSTTIEGSSSLALTGDAGIDVAARAITITGDAEVSITSPAQVAVDGGGGTATFAAGTVQICE